MTENEARDAIHKAVQAYAEIRADSGTPFVSGWVLSYEAMTTEGLEDGFYDGGIIVPDQQSPALSRGLAMHAVDFYAITGAPDA